ncbi:GNAT family N-acetyltransferase [Halomonas sp. ISL-106]|nr:MULTISPECIES: GNAT family N-acetyltransferase [unclassified Halomonas]MBT2785527.1 GNAT family N-acetyltransferase [Halomonas sp. ISL-106]MBT2797789.1 GNAT family N-acetyltransferase [Halomonas sp. ISL-104]
MSFVAKVEGKLEGTIMAGHDGKRGYVQRLSVVDSHRRRGIATEQVNLCLEALKNDGILKSHLMILPQNKAAQKFWASQGWAYRSDVLLYSFVSGDNLNI